jgi:hypothetical protein
MGVFHDDRRDNVTAPAQAVWLVSGGIAKYAGDDRGYPPPNTMREFSGRVGYSVRHDIENGQLQVGLIRINAICLMEMHVITARIFGGECKRSLYPRQQSGFDLRTVDVELARTGRGDNKCDTIALTCFEDLHVRLFFSNIETVGSIMRANGEVWSRKVSGRKIYSTEEKCSHGDDSYPA